jgi:tetratricopeptide (TPR) repeat protein
MAGEDDSEEQVPRVTVSDQARVGIVGDHARVGTMNMVLPRREVAWPVAVGAAPPVASAFQQRRGVLERVDRAGPVVVLSGNGGVGKSQIAAGIYHAAEADLRVWVSAESRTSVIAAYAAAADRLELGNAEDDPEESARLLLQFLAETDKSCLVVLDDLADPADMAGWWPADHARVVVTTRWRDAALSGGGRTVVDMDVYTVQDAVSYLTERLTPFLDQLPQAALEKAEELGADLGRLPLGLAQAAAVIINQGISCAEYRSWFADRSRALEDLFPVDADADGYAKTVATTWALAIESANRLNPAGLARPMAELIAVLDPAGAPEGVCTSQVVREHLARVTGEDAVSVTAPRSALRALHRLSVITHDPDPASTRGVGMHNLTGRAVLQSLEAEDISALVRVAADALVESWPEVESSAVSAEALRANAAMLDAVNGDALWAQETGGHPVLFRSGLSLLEVGLANQASTYFDELSQHAERVLGPDHPHTLASRHNLAYAYREAGDLGRAIPLYKQTLADRERVLGPDHPDTLGSRNNLAGAYQSAGDLGRAVPLFEQTLADRERVLRPDHPDTLVSRNNLAHAYQSAGDLGRAIPLYKQTLADTERVRGPDHPHTLALRHNLAYAYRAAGDLGRAIPLYKQTLADRERVLGPDHPDTLDSRNNLAAAYRAAGDLGRALPLYKQTLADRERVLGPDHPDTLDSRNNLAGAYRTAGDLDRALPLYKQALADRERVLGRDHPDTLASRNNLAYAYQSAGDLDRALPLYEQTLADAERVLGPDNPTTLTMRNNLASAYGSAGELGREILLYEQNLADAERVLGPDHPDTLASRNNLASAYWEVGDLGRALPLYEQVRAAAERVLGPDNPTTLTMRHNLASAYREADDLGRAIPLYEQTLAGRERVLGPEHPDTVGSRNNLASAYQAAGGLGREGASGQDRDEPLDGASVYSQDWLLSQSPPDLPAADGSAGEVASGTAPTVSLDAAVREALGIEVRLGALGIDVPPLRQGRNDLVKVVISRSQEASNVVAALVAQSQAPAVETINTSAVMFVELTGRSFEIRRLNPQDGEQLISETACWEFNVLPLSAGKQSLTVSASMRIPVPGRGEKTVSVPSLERKITVDVDRLYAGRTFMRRNWQWIGTSVLAGAAIVAGILWR